MAAAAPPTVAPDGASDKIINPRRSERLKKIEPTPATSVDIQPRSTLRARRPVDPVRRRKQAWPFKWENWRINAVAFQMSRSDTQVIEHVRASQDELWRKNPQEASLNEDALLVYDEQQQDQQAPSEPQEGVRPESPAQQSIVGQTESHDVAALLDMEYADHPKVYVEEKVTANKTLRLSTDQPKSPAKVTKPRKPVKRLQQKVVALPAPPAPPAPSVPANLPLKAPPGTPGIPRDALAINDFFQKDTPCALGVQLPVDRARTRWEWADYVTRKGGNAQFDWGNDQHIRDANRWRQQRIRRRFTEHGVFRDGRKHA